MGVGQKRHPHRQGALEHKVWGDTRGSSQGMFFWGFLWDIQVEMLWNPLAVWVWGLGGSSARIEIVNVFRAWARVGSKWLTVDTCHLILIIPVNWYDYAFTRDEETEV